MSLNEILLLLLSNYQIIEGIHKRQMPVRGDTLTQNNYMGKLNYKGKWYIIT